jgi:hypothetical protein
MIDMHIKDKKAARRGVAALVAGAAGAITTVAAGQGAAAPLPPPSYPQVEFSVGAEYEHQFTTDLDGMGDYTVNRASAAVGARAQLTDNVLLSISLGYRLDSFEFRGASGFDTPDPFGDIHTASLSAVFTLELSDEWSIFGGPVAQSSRESGADFGESIIGGGVIGVTWQASQELLIGGGLGVVSQIEDDPRFFPILVLEWQMADTLRLTSQTSPGGARTGLELVWGFAPGWELAVGGAYEFRRFLLKNNADVAEEERIPFWLRASYQPSPRVRLDVYAGIADENTIAVEYAGPVPHTRSVDADLAGILGAAASVRF